MWQEFSSPNLDPNWQKSKKTRGVGWENVHKKLSHESNTLYLAYNIPLRLLYRSPPLTTLTSHYVHRNSGAHFTKTTTTASKEDNDQKGGGRSVFFPPTNGFSDLPRYNIRNIIQHCSFFVLSFLFYLTRIIYISCIFNTASFCFSHWIFFSLFWVFL